MSTSNRQRAWEYYKHADTLQHQRHGFMLVAQSMFFAAYAQVAASGRFYGLQFGLAVLGAAFAIAWCVLGSRLQAGMTTLSRHLAGEDAQESDPVYEEYLRALEANGSPSAAAVLHFFLPWTALIAWAFLVVRTIR